MILRSSKLIACIKASCLTNPILVTRDVVLLLQLPSTAIRIASKVKILCGAVGEQRSNLSSHNVCLDRNIVDAKCDIVRIQDPHVAHRMIETINTERSSNNTHLSLSTRINRNHLPLVQIRIRIRR